MRRRLFVERTLLQSRIGLRLAPIAVALLLPGSAAFAQFGPAPSYGTATNFPTQNTPQSVTVAKFNGDNVLDLAVVNATSDSVTVLLGTGNGGFAPAPASPFSTGLGTGPVDVAAGDVNGDGKIDIVTANVLLNNVTVLLGDGLGGFAPAVGSPFAAGVAPTGIAIGEVTGNTAVDLVVANSGGNNISVLSGDGALAVTFAAPVNYATGTDPRDVALAQLNPDGRLDVVVSNFVSGSVSVLLGNALGTLDAAVSYPAGAGARTVAVGNLNGDANVDVVVANRSAATVSVLIGNGDGTLQAAANFPAGAEPLGIAVGDFNVDNKTDVAVSNFTTGTNTVTLLTGNGAGQLQNPGTPFATGANPIGIGVGDFDGDTRADLAVPNNGSNNISVLLNNLALQADLSVTKTDGQTNAVPGAAVTYTITVSNAGPNILTQLTLNDGTLPQALGSPAFTPASGLYNPGTGAWTGLQLLPGGSVIMTLAGIVNSAATGNLVNTASVATILPDTDPDTNNNTGSDTDTLVPVANLGISKTGAASLNAGQNVTYTISVTNAGPSSAVGVSVADPDSAGLTFVSNDCLNVFPCSLGGMTVGQTKTISAVFKVGSGAPGSVTNTATVSATSADSDTTNNVASATSTVTQSANLRIVKTGPATVTPGQNVTYTIAVTNDGPSDATGASVADVTPAGLTFVSNDCLNTFPCVLGGLTALQTKTVVATYSIPASYLGPLANTATVTATTPDPNTANNTSTANSTVVQRADLGITNTGPASVVPGQEVTYTLTVTNNGPSDATTVQVADPAPTGLTFVANAGDCTTLFPCALGPLPSGQAKSIQATFKVASNYSGPATISNPATVSTTATDPVPGNNVATASTTVLAASAGLKITKTGPPSAVPGANVTYTITVTNLGPSDALNVQVTDPTPTGLTFVSNSGDCTAAFPCNLAAVQVGASRTITATYSIPAAYAGADPVQNVASVSSSTADPDSSDNSATASTSVSGQPFFTLTPCRVLDTRDPVGSLGGPALAPGPARPFTISGVCGVPSTAKAISINITITQPTDPGDLRIYPAGSPQPLASMINYAPGQTRANNGVVQLGVGGALEVLTDQAAGTVHFILDVNGYFE